MNRIQTIRNHLTRDTSLYKKVFPQNQLPVKLDHQRGGQENPQHKETKSEVKNMTENNKKNKEDIEIGSYQPKNPGTFGYRPNSSSIPNPTPPKGGTGQSTEKSHSNEK